MNKIVLKRVDGTVIGEYEASSTKEAVEMAVEMAVENGTSLSGADLSGADLSGADLSEANLAPIKADVLDVLSRNVAEVPGLLAALKGGRVDGTVYEGECACLVGTLANLRKCNYKELSPNSNRPAERWFLGISKGDTPENNQISKVTVGWVEEWLGNQG